LAGEEVAHDIAKAILKAQDQSPALGHLGRLRSCSLESPQFGDMRAQVREQRIESSLVGHDPAS
jgi:hypothetical protein